MRINRSNSGLTGGYSTFNAPARRMRDAAAASGGFIHKQAVIGNKIGWLLQQAVVLLLRNGRRYKRAHKIRNLALSAI